MADMTECAGRNNPVLCSDRLGERCDECPLRSRLPSAQPAGDAEELAQWLDKKWSRHRETEDKQVAAMLRSLSRANAEQAERIKALEVNVGLTFAAFRKANVTRCVKWHPAGIGSWSPSDWLTAVTGELGELASLLKMRNRERDGLPGNRFSPTDKQIADELADVLTYLDLLAEALGVDLAAAAVAKFNEVSERVGFPDRITP